MFYNPFKAESFEWDQEKNRSNVEKHRVSFEEAQLAFLDPEALLFEDLTNSSNEARYFCYGKVEGAILTVRFTYRENKIRIFGAGSIFDIFGRKQTEEFSLTNPQLDLPIKFVELWADRKPYLEEIVLTGHDLDTMNQMQRSVNKRLDQYSPGLNQENFNKFDQKILNVASYWNDYFSKQDFPPSILLDPNLIKAMMYVESKMGFFQASAGNYPASPDVMQIADPRNPAIHTLNYDGWIDPATGKPAKEYSWSPSGPVILDYQGNAIANTEYDSIYWAVRWLFHKAEIIHDNGKRSWRTWPEAVARYNGGGDPEYLNKVETIYEKGDWQ